MLTKKLSIGKKLLLFILSFVFLFISSAVYANEIKEIWNHITINGTNYDSIGSKTKSIWEEFEKRSIQRGMVVKPNYQPYVPVINRIIILDTPAAEIAYRGYNLRVETEVIYGVDVRITEITLSKISRDVFPNATREQHIGYSNGKLGEIIKYWHGQKKIIPEELAPLEQLNLESFKRAIELEPSSGDVDDRRVPLKDVFHFFPEISNDLRLDFDYLYPQNEKPMFKCTFEPGRIRFGSILDTDVRISYIINSLTARMLHGEISWKMTITEFATGEELALCSSFFNFMQECLAKIDLIAPASPVLF